MTASQILSYYKQLRFPAERRALVAAVINLTIFVVAFGFFSAGTALLAGLLVLWTVAMVVRVNHQRQIGGAVRVGANQLPELAAQAARAAEIVQSPAVQLFVTQDGRLSAYSFGWDAPQAIVLSSRMVDTMNNDEMRFVLGHEMGHIALGHTRLGTVFGGVVGVPAMANLANFLLPGFYWWKRCAEFSADRAGVLACRDLNHSISALVKLMVGKTLAEKVNLEEIMQQANELTSQIPALAGEINATHPYLIYRVRQLVQFWNSPECRGLLRQMEA